jgi:hypothetical protein
VCGVLRTRLPLYRGTDNTIYIVIYTKTFSPTPLCDSSGAAALLGEALQRLTRIAALRRSPEPGFRLTHAAEAIEGSKARKTMRICILISRLQSSLPRRWGFPLVRSSMRTCGVCTGGVFANTATPPNRLLPMYRYVCTVHVRYSVHLT